MMIPELEEVVQEFDELKQGSLSEDSIDNLPIIYKTRAKLETWYDAFHQDVSDRQRKLDHEARVMLKTEFYLNKLFEGDYCLNAAKQRVTKKRKWFERKKESTEVDPELIPELRELMVFAEEVFQQRYYVSFEDAMQDVKKSAEKQKLFWKKAIQIKEKYVRDIQQLGERYKAFAQAKQQIKTDYLSFQTALKQREEQIFQSMS